MESGHCYFLLKLKKSSSNPADYSPVSPISYAGKVAGGVIQAITEICSTTLSSLKTNLGSKGTYNYAATLEVHRACDKGV
jgi:hypothetical protein